MLTADGRIGEDTNKLESRLLKSNGVLLRDEKLLEQRLTGMPYLDYEEFFPSPYEIKLYFKSSNGIRPKSNEISVSKMINIFDKRIPPKKPQSSIDSIEETLKGWELHVLFVRGISVLEVYKKTDQITDDESKQILALQSGNSFWAEISDEDLPDGKFSALGFDLERDDKFLRAKRLNPRAIMIFRTQTDEYFYQSKQRENTQRAPSSVKGF